MLQKPCHVFAKWSYTDTLYIAPVGLGHLAACCPMNSISWKNKNTRLWLNSARCHFPCFSALHLQWEDRTCQTAASLLVTIGPHLILLRTDVVWFHFPIIFENHRLHGPPWLQIDPNHKEKPKLWTWLCFACIIEKDHHPNHARGSLSMSTHWLHLGVWETADLSNCVSPGTI